jgi:L-ascorbate metabolism protein UlaG (beta-lactamase superfamily)
VEAEPFPLAGGDALGVTATWTGVAGLVLERAGTRIAFDPLATRPGLWATLFRRPRSDADLVRRTFGALDAVFVGHAHYDHALDVPALARASPAARLVGGGVALDLARRLGVAPERLAEARDGARFVVGPFTVEAVASEHGAVPLLRHVDRLRLPPTGVPATPFRYPRGEVFAWRVEAGGGAIHVHGSAGIDDHALARQGPADVLVACLAARGGTPRYFERLGERLRPRVLVPCHHDDFFRPLAEPPRPLRGIRWSAFLDEAAGLARAHGTRLWVPPRGVARPW